MNLIAGALLVVTGSLALWGASKWVDHSRETAAFDAREEAKAAKIMSILENREKENDRVKLAEKLMAERLHDFYFPDKLSELRIRPQDIEFQRELRFSISAMWQLAKNQRDSGAIGQEEYDARKAGLEESFYKDLESRKYDFTTKKDSPEVTKTTFNRWPILWFDTELMKSFPEVDWSKWKD